ncbi:hypothetical protein EXIGLDRAFT_48290 [Exidia glandulosa HHB12029]|uniref:Uncharacterized protein n=1 Tax=Exidia glandulosa HHB12029 TaxID=1314781 RepID=A0A165P6U7_EXIGL|nr:hypothetical protein EXIGLDRAFT_48290 [Exidia glandulosa HHB12029]
MVGGGERMAGYGSTKVLAMLTGDQTCAYLSMKHYAVNLGYRNVFGRRSARICVDDVVDELSQAISSFYFTERLSVLRCYIPLVRAKENVDDPLHDVASL